jgi:2-polyprenyl-3-methyl-5-hydroxy-6-metoxy-1,4-benzoquinol methylase
MKKNDIAEERAAPKVHETVLQLLSDEKRGRVLDAAAGEGALTKKLLELGFEVNSVDINPSIFKLQGTQCIKLDLNYGLPFPEKHFDYIVSLETLEHLWNPYGCIREFYRVLKPRGKLIVSTPNISTIFSRILFLFTGRFAGFREVDYEKTGHITPIPIWQIKQFLNQLEFKIEYHTYNRGYIPKIKLEVPSKNKYLGQISILKMIKT